MFKSKSFKKIARLFTTIALAGCLSLSSALALGFSFTSSNAVEGVIDEFGDKDTLEMGRVTVEDLMARYPIDYVVGPVDVVNTAVDYKYKYQIKYQKNDSGELLKDEGGNPIPEVDEEGNTVYETDEEGNKIPEVDEEGNPVFETDTEGNKIPEEVQKIDRNDLDESGHYTYKKENREKDVYGRYVKDTCTSGCTHQKDDEGYRLTNNIYGIPAEQFFDVESFIHTKPNTGANGGRILYGWKPNIRSIVRTVNPVTGEPEVKPEEKLAENGEILGSNGRLTENPSLIGMHVTYSRNDDTSIHSESINEFGSTEQYMLIVPDDITEVGTSSGTYVYGGKAYYANGSYTSASRTATVDDFTDFGCFIADRKDGSYSPKVLSKINPYFWQPRERLVGVYFSENSNLKTIQDGADPGGNNRLTQMKGAKGAFAYCTAMRFFIRPDSATVGNYAFAHCSSLVDANRPSSYGTGAYDDCDSLIKGSDTIFVMGNRQLNGVNDTGAFIFKRTSAGAVSAISIAGATGEDANKVFSFPSGTDFTNGSNRRQGVAYDYLNSSANKIKYNLKKLFGETPNITYSIASKFAYEKWCQNVVLPVAVT